ncbi:hypothetical protein M1439_00525, partial [Candidatus Marsarchaeota archaeon]|nr:hypothetical protein [Candidatus Marsarchaeota archaeon]
MSKPINMDQKGRQQISDFRSMRGIDALKPETAPERNKLIVERDESLVAAFAKYSVYKKKGLDAEAEKLRERYQLNDFILYQLTGTGRSSIYDKNVPIADLAGEVKRLEVSLW